MVLWGLLLRFIFHFFLLFLFFVWLRWFNNIFLGDLCLLSFLIEFFAKLTLLILSKSGPEFVDHVSLSMWEAIHYKSFVNWSIFISYGHLLGLIYLSFHKSCNELLFADFQNSTTLRSIVLPLSVVVVLSLVLAEAMSHTFSKLAHVDVLPGY